MEKASRIKWMKKWMSILLMLCLLVPCLSAPHETVRHPENNHGNRSSCPNENDYLSETGFCCNKCHKGETVEKDCLGEGMRTTCKACGNDTYMDQINYKAKCLRCTKCRADRFEVVDTPCNRRQNRVCRCMDGYYKNPFLPPHKRECLKCPTCGPEKSQTRGCTGETDTECACKDSKNCTLPESTPTPKTEPVLTMPGPIWLANPFYLLGGGILLMTVVVVSLVIMYIRKMRMPISSSPSEDITSQDSTETSTERLIQEQEKAGKLEQAVPFSSIQVCECEQPLSTLPDCVPHEIKIPQLIYSVMKEVPVRHMKQLVRSLDVSEREIERAENDHPHACEEAHYQMLRVWAERGPGGGGGGGVLPRVLLQNLLQKLRDMDLGGVAEELETKYGVQ